MKHVLALVVLLFCVSCGQPHASSTQSEFTTTADPTRWWPTSLAEDGNLSRQHVLYRYYAAALGKELPLRFFRELIQAQANVKVKEGSWPRYVPGSFGGGTIEVPRAAQPEQWTRGDWSNFYNELFHAWWGNVFMKSSS